MNLSIIGTGYVGLPTGVGFAQLGVNVTCIDRDEKKVGMLRSGKSHLFEAGLDDLLSKNIAAGRLVFTSSMRDGLKKANVVVVAVGTPPDPKTGAADMSHIHSAIRELAGVLDHYAVVVVKSTVPVGTGEAVEKIIRETNPELDVDVVSMPEFLREGFAVEEFFKPDRIVIGTDSDRAISVLKELYQYFMGKTRILYVKRRSAEVIKYASNAFLAMKIHYVNEMADFCEHVGADVFEVAQGMGSDSRIGYKFLNPGPGYGGSCFPKDTMAMAHMGRDNGVPLSLVENTIQKNADRKVAMADRILAAVQDVEYPHIGVLGLAFKGGTDDVRESPAMEIVAALIKKGARIKAFDPKAMENARQLIGDKIAYARDMYDAVSGTDVIAVLTEWDDFKQLDLTKVAALVKTKKIVDCRNLVDPVSARNAGFIYKGIGR